MGVLDADRDGDGGARQSDDSGQVGIVLATDRQEGEQLEHLVRQFGLAILAFEIKDDWQGQLRNPSVGAVFVGAGASLDMLREIARSASRHDASVIRVRPVEEPEGGESGNVEGVEEVPDDAHDPRFYNTVTKVFKERRRKSRARTRHGAVRRLLIGDSNNMEQVRALIHRVAPTNATVMLQGETGTGKEVAARAIWRASERHDKPFVAVNCGAIPGELLESELFGHEKGAFTGAVSARQGRFELAQGGTLFLDEIGDMPMPMQVKLLRVLQERRFERVGGSRSIECDVRVVTATHRDLEVAIEQGDFRQDLYYRLNVFPIALPPLRERGDDLPLLIDHLSERLEHDGMEGVRFSPPAIDVLKHYDWPGNVRQLANLVERSAIMYPQQEVGVADLPHKILDAVGVERPDTWSAKVDSTPDHVPFVPTIPEEGLDLKGHLAQLEATLIREALDRTNGVVAHAAQLLHVQRTTLIEKIRKYSLGRQEDAANF